MTDGIHYSLGFVLTFRLSWAELPAIETEYESLWRFARALQRADLSIDGWHPRASSVKASLRIRAFDSAGPTPAALAMAKAEKQEYPGVCSLGAWNGIEGNGGAAFTDLLSVDGLCSVRLRTK